MTGENYVVRLFEEANPIPDPASFANTVGARFESIEKRSKTMTITELKGADPQRPPGNRRGLVLGAAIAALVVIVGIGTFAATQNSTPQASSFGQSDVVGVWDITTPDADEVTERNPVWITYEADGTYVIERSDFEGVTEVFDAGQYEIADGVITFTTTLSQDGQCEPGQVGTARISVASQDEWSITTISDECAERGQDQSPHIHTPQS